MKKVKCALVCASLGGVFAIAPNAAASEPMTHDGFYMSLQAGFGYLSSTAEAGGLEATYSGATFSSAILLGGTIGPVVIGGGMTYDNAFSPSVEFGGMSADLDDVNLYLIGFDAFVDYYIDPTEGLHFVGYLGWGGLEASVNGDVSGSDPTGILFGLGGGYDFWIADEWSVGPLARFIYAPLSRDDVDFNTMQFSVLADFKYH